MPSTNTDCVKIVFKPVGLSTTEGTVIAVNVVVQGRDVELAIERARQVVKLDKTAWTVKRVVEGPGGIF